MPITKSAKKALRQSLRRRDKNIVWKNKVKAAIKKALSDKSAELVSVAYQAVDKAAKNHIIPANKASRIKSRLARLNTAQSKK